MTVAIRVLGLDRAKWARVGPHRLWSAMSLAVAASAVMALNRFGGALVDAPRAFFRLALIGIWGWLALALGIWLVAALPNPSGRAPTRSSLPSFQHTLAGVGAAHTPVLMFGIVILVSAGMLQTLGPGFVAAVFVFGFWFPAGLTVAVHHAHGLTIRHAVVIVAVPYTVWLLVIGRHLLGQVQHLL